MGINKENRITTSKSKQLKLLLVSLTFVGIGLWMIIVPRMDSTFSLFNNRIFVITSGIISILFFGLCSVIFFLQLIGYKHSKKGIVINQNGINDNSNTNSIGFIPWTDIKEVKINSVLGNNFLTIVVYNPHDYINRQVYLSKRKGMETDLESTGSPINISTGTLNINTQKLYKKIELEFNDFKKKACR